MSKMKTMALKNKTFKKIKKFKRYYKELKMKKNWESVKIL